MRTGLTLLSMLLTVSAHASNLFEESIGTYKVKSANCVCVGNSCTGPDQNSKFTTINLSHPKDTDLADLIIFDMTNVGFIALSSINEKTADSSNEARFKYDRYTKRSRFPGTRLDFSLRLRKLGSELEFVMTEKSATYISGAESKTKCRIVGEHI